MATIDVALARQSPPLRPGDRNILLVDDVVDSGESLRAASAALRPANVYPLVMARAKHQDRK